MDDTNFNFSCCEIVYVQWSSIYILIYPSRLIILTGTHLLYKNNFHLSGRICSYMYGILLTNFSRSVFNPLVL